MASAAGIIIAAGTLTLANEAISAPLDANGVPTSAPINWRVIPATAVAALLFYGIEQLNHTLGVGLASMALITTLITPMGNTGISPVANIATFMGYGPKDTPTADFVNGLTYQPLLPPNHPKPGAHPDQRQ